LENWNLFLNLSGTGLGPGPRTAGRRNAQYGGEGNLEDRSKVCLNQSLHSEAKNQMTIPHKDQRSWVTLTVSIHRIDFSKFFCEYNFVGTKVHCQKKDRVLRKLCFVRP